MQVIITGTVSDSSATLEQGRIEFTQVQRFDDGTTLVTGSMATAQVVQGELRSPSGGAFSLPANPEGTAVRIREVLGGQTYEWWAAVPPVDSVEYRALPPVESGSVPESVWGPPPWLAEVLAARDEIVQAVDDGTAVAAALGGLAGLEALVDDAAASASAAGASQDGAAVAADRARTLLGGRTWVQDAEPDEGASYRWLGVPGSSASEQVVGGIAVGTNLAINPRMGTAVSLPLSNYPGVVPATKGVAVPEPHPEGILTALEGRIEGSGEGPFILSVYGLNGLANIDSEHATFGIWVYVNAPGYRVTGNGFALTAIPDSEWLWVEQGTPAAAGAWTGIAIERADGGSPDLSHRAYVTGVNQRPGAESPSRFWDGDTPADRASDLWVDTSAAETIAIKGWDGSGWETLATAAREAVDVSGLTSRVAAVEAAMPGKASVESVEAITPYTVVADTQLYSYGHSYTMVPSPYTTPNGGEYPLVLGRLLSSCRVYPRGRSGTPAPDTWVLASSAGFNPSGDTARVWTPGSKGIVVHQNYMNEAPAALGSDPLYRDMWLRSVRSLIGLWSSSDLKTAGQLTRRGTWTLYGNLDRKDLFPGADAYFAAESGAEIDYTVTGDEVWVIATASAAGYTLGSFQVRVGAQVLRTVSANGTNPLYTSTVKTALAGSNWWPCAYRVTGLNAAAGTTGAKTVTIRTTSTSTVFIGGCFNRAVNPPAVFLAKEPPRPADAAGYSTYLVNDPVFRGMIDTLVAEFPNVHAVDLAPGYDLPRFVSSTDTVGKHHPNDLGQRYIAERFLDAIRTAIPEPISGVLTL